MKNFIKSTSFKMLSILLAVCLLGMFFAAITNSSSSPVTSITGFVFSPLQRLASYAANTLENFSGGFVSASTYKNQVEELELQLAEYQSQLVDYEKLKKKVESYEEFLEVKENNPDYQFVASTVIGRDAADLFGSFTLNTGSNEGVSVNCPVIHGEYLIGVVKEVNPTTCVVYTILHPQVNVSAYEIRSGEVGYVNTTTKLSLDGVCQLSGLIGNTTVASGGIVCTSGIGGIYPRGLIVGTVTGVGADEGNISSNAKIKLDVDYKALQDVFIITNFEGKE